MTSIQKSLAMVAIASTISAPTFVDAPVYPINVYGDDHKINGTLNEDYVGPTGRPKKSNRKKLRKLARKARRKNRK